MTKNHLELELRLQSYQADIRTHQHDYHQLVLPLSGRMKMKTDQFEGYVAVHQAAVIPAKTGHQYSAQGDNLFIVANIPVVLAPELAKLPRLIELDEAICQYLMFLKFELQNDSQPDVTALHQKRQMLLLLVQLLTERFSETLRIDRRLEIARRYIDTHLDAPLKLAEVANVAHLSQRQLNTLFQRYFDMTTQQYLLEQRMQLAWRLIMQTGLSVQQVSEKCGYLNLSAFSHRISLHFGHSPRQLRNSQAGISTISTNY